ncbi:MAG: zinc-finger domain-containing protein [Salaquimonas sp.]
MAVTTIPHYKNDLGVAEVKIGVKEFMCCGASDPHDHPHVFLDMGEESQIVCPYCSTLFSLKSDLGTSRTEPEGCVLQDA